MKNKIKTPQPDIEVVCNEDGLCCRTKIIDGILHVPVYDLSLNSVKYLTWDAFSALYNYDYKKVEKKIIVKKTNK